MSFSITGYYPHPTAAGDYVEIQAVVRTEQERDLAIQGWIDHEYRFLYSKTARMNRQELTQYAQRKDPGFDLKQVRVKWVQWDVIGHKETYTYKLYRIEPLTRIELLMDDE